MESSPGSLQFRVTSSSPGVGVRPVGFAGSGPTMDNSTTVPEVNAGLSNHQLNLCRSSTSDLLEPPKPSFLSPNLKMYRSKVSSATEAAFENSTVNH